MSNKKPWRYSESRSIAPFKISERALAGTGFRARPDGDFSTADPWSSVLEPEDFHSEKFAPEFRLAVDTSKLLEDCGRDPSELSLSILVRDPALWRSECIETWPMEEVPERYRPDSDWLGTISGARGLEFAVQIAPRRELSQEWRLASRPGQIVASRRFEIQVPDDGAGFPIELVPPAYFEELGLPKSTIWVIRWLSTADFDRPPEEVLCVLINKEEGERLLRLSAQDALGQVLWREVATEVFVEVCLTVFRGTPDKPQLKDSLLARIASKLKSVSNSTFDELVKLAETPEAAQFFRAHLQSAFELSDRIKAVRLAGRAV